MEREDYLDISDSNYEPEDEEELNDEVYDEDEETNFDVDDYLSRDNLDDVPEEYWEG
ncbi:hypothetical protein ACFL5V_08445 [Fibrobacterota bacterium]